eukprot:949190-Pyramimonas_sp.AAC.1
MSGPTEKDLAGPQKMDRYLAGARDYKMQLLPNKGDIAVECWVDAEWADDKTDGISTRGGILKHHGRTTLSWSRRQAARHGGSRTGIATRGVGREAVAARDERQQQCATHCQETRARTYEARGDALPGAAA